MAFSEQSLAEARQQGYSDDEIFDHIALSDERFSVAKQQGYSLDDIAAHLKQKEGGVNYEDATSKGGQGPLDNRNEERAVQGEVQAGSTEGVQADSMLPAEDQSQFRSDDQARVTTGVPQGGELIEGQTKDAQGGIQGQEEGQGLRGQIPTGDEAQVIAPQQAAMQAAPFGAEGVQPTPAKEKGIIDYTGEAFKSAYKGLGTMASELQQFGWDLSKRVNPVVTIARDAEAVFGQNPFSEKIKKEIVEKGDKYFQDLVAGSKLTPEEAQSPLNQFFFGAGHMIGDVALAMATGGGSAEARALQSASDLPIWKSIATKSVDGIKSFAAPSLLAANATIDEERQAGKTDTEALAAGMKRLVEMEAGAALPMQVSSGLDNVFLRGASRILQSTPLAVAQGELATAAGNMLASEAERRPTISENIITGNFEEAAKDLAQVAPMGLIGMRGGRTRQIKEAGLPATAAALESTAKAEIEAVPTEVKPAEAPAEAQPTKPSEAKIAEAGGLPPLERKPVEPEATVEAKEGVAPREGEGEAEKVAPPTAEAEKPEAVAPEGTRVASAAYLAPDGNVYEGKSHIEAMEKAKEAGAITQEQIDAKQSAESRNTDEFGYVVTQPDGTRTPTTREAAGKIAKQSGQALKEQFDFGDKMHSNEVALDDFAPKAEAPIETRGKGVQYHGARGELPELYEGYYNPDNIYGGMDTFYTTDATDIAAGYGRKKPSATIYQTKEKSPVSFYDMENPKTVEEWNEFFGLKDGGNELIETAIAEATNDGKSPANLRQIMDEMRVWSSGMDISKDQVQEMFQVIVENLSQQGYGGMTHIGGLKTNKKPHTVKIYFDAKNQLEFKKVEPSAIEPTKPAEAPTAPQAEPTFIQKAESWADSVIKESSKRVSTGLDPEVLAAYAVKGSIVIGRGVRNFGVWSGEMVKQFGEEIRPHLKDIWSRAKSYAEDEAKIQMDTKDYIQRREEAVAGGGPTVMRGVSERIMSELPELKPWEEKRQKLLEKINKFDAGTEQRKLAEEEYADHLKNKPESPKEYYIQADELVRRKSLSDVEVMEWTESLTPEQAKAEYERAIFAPASDEKTAAIKVKLAARRLTDLEAAGDDAGYAQVVNEVAREITVAAQVLRDARFLYKATPKGFTTLLEKVAEKKNIKIKPEKIAEIEAQFKDFTEAGKRSEAKELEVLNAKSEEEFDAALKDLEKLRKEGFKKQNALDKTVGGIWPKSGREELIPTLLKGNLLTTMSVATNLAQNVLKGTFLDVPQKFIRSQYSKVESLLTGKEPKYIFGLEQAAKYYATLAKESPELVRNLFRTALRQPLPADKPVNIMEIRSSLNPMAAIRRLKGIYNKESLQYEGDYGFKEAVKDSLEATTGVTADVFFDLLTATDRPFRQAVMISEASGIANKLGLKGLEKEKFLKLPQQGIEKWARENIKDPAKRAEEIKNLKQELENAVSEGLGEAEVTIGGKNVTRGVSNFINNIAKSNPITSLLVYSNAPYVRFPLNFAVNAFKLSNPELAAVSFFYNAARGNSKKAAIDFSIMASGVALAYAGKYLYDQGVIQTTDSPQTKAQKLSGELGRAGSINLSKLKRIVNGETSDTMPGDKMQRLDRLGLIGVAILAEADKQEALKKKKLLTSDVSFADALVTRMAQLPVSLSYTMNQTFAKGVAGVVDALTQGEQKAEKLLKNTFAASLSIVMPNELSAISRYISDYTPNLDDPKFMKTLENAVRQRMGMTGDLPIKRGFWGEKVPSTPEGANPIAYHFFDFTKQRKLPSVPATMEIIRLFEKTQDNRIIPSEVQDKITIKGSSYRLSAKDHERYQELVGGERLNRVNKLIDSPSYQSASIDRRADRFSKAIDRGARMGERKFLQELQKSGREAGEVLKIPRKELIRRIAELEKED